MTDSEEDQSLWKRISGSERRPPASSRAERMMQAARDAAPKRQPADPRAEPPPSARSAALEWLAEERRRPRAFPFPESPVRSSAAAAAARTAPDSPGPSAARSDAASGDAVAPGAEEDGPVPLEAGLRDLLRGASDLRLQPLLPTR